MGKSSAIIKIRDLSKKKGRKHKYFVYAVDVRTAMSPRYVEMALFDSIIKAEGEGFINRLIENLQLTSINQLFTSSAFQSVLSYLHENNKVLILIFDQFEELFSKKEMSSLFDNVRRLSNFVDSQKQNIILGFAWKTDLTIPLDHPAYYLWSSLEDRRREFEITQFTPSEVKSAINKFSLQLGEKVNPILANYLAKQCQGYPWLLKKLSIHIYDLINKGHSQESVIGQKLNIVDLFEHDLSSLMPDEHSCVKTIAKETPADNHTIVNLYSDHVVSSLVNKRLVIRRASKLTLYWDIFRDYVLNKTIPTIVIDYMPNINSR